jgi:hypothetical protein
LSGETVPAANVQDIVGQVERFVGDGGAKTNERKERRAVSRVIRRGE